MYVRHFLNHVVIFFCPLWRPLWPRALDNRLVRLMVAPALLAYTVSIFTQYLKKTHSTITLQCEPENVHVILRDRVSEMLTFYVSLEQLVILSMVVLLLLSFNARGFFRKSLGCLLCLKLV